MKSKHIQRLLRLLLSLLGAGLGAAMTLAAVQLHTWTRPGQALPGGWLIVSYVGTALLGALILFLLSPAIIRRCSDGMTALESQIDRLTFSQVAAGTSGLVCGLLIAALVSQVLKFMGNSIFTTAFSAILYVLLGTTGLSVGMRRSEDIGALMGRLPGLRDCRIVKKADLPRPRVLDASTLQDGRILGVCRTGFLTGELILPVFVQEELTLLAESPDPVRRMKGRLGLDTLKRLRQERGVVLRVESGDAEADQHQDPDARLLRLVRSLNAALITCDSAMSRIAGLSEIPVMNLNELAVSLRATVQTGQELLVTLLKEGKEPEQGVAYLDDGTMVVVEGGRSRLGQQVAVTVTSALQTNAGRMVFARLRE